MADPTKWDWADAISGAAMGALTGVVSLFGWFGRKLSGIHKRIDEVQKHVHTHESNIAVLRAHHEANLNFQNRIDRTLQAVNDKQDAQMQILMELKGRDH